MTATDTSGSPAPAVRLLDLRKSFGAVEAVRGVSFDVPYGAYVCLLGPSGCGKTTILRSIAGFHVPSSGRIEVAGRDVASVPPNKRRLGMVYQNYALFPHLSVRENVAFGLKMRGLAGAERNARVAQMLDLVHLRGLEDRRPRELSGGQQQRVALARAIAIEPEVLLLDEPLSNLDAKLRKRMQLELKSLQRRMGLTTVHVTHDQEEALTLADIVVILNEGKIVQMGAPREVYARPDTVFVADFLGRANLLEGTSVAAGADRRVFRSTPGWTLVSTAPLNVADGDPCVAFIRPELMGLILEPSPETASIATGGGLGNRVRGRVVDVIFSGPLAAIEIALEGDVQVTVERPSGDPAARLQVGAAAEVVFPEDSVLLLPPR